MTQRINWKVAMLVVLMAAGLTTLQRALAIGAVISDPTLCPVYSSPTMPGIFLYPDGGCSGYTYWVPIGDGGYIQVPPPKTPPPATPAPDAGATKPKTQSVNG